MLPFVFTLTMLGGGLGLYFILLAGVVVMLVLAAPAIAGYRMYMLAKEFFSENSDLTFDNSLAEDGVNSYFVEARDKTVDAEVRRQIESVQVDQLLEFLPEKGHHEAGFSKVGDKWVFRFKLNSFGA